MENATDLIIRKLTATFVVTAVASIMMAGYHVLGDRGSGVQYHLGTQLMEWSFIYAMYIGAIVLIYGNAVSIGIMWVRNKWFERQAWLAVGLHGFFGLGIGILIPSGFYMLSGIVIALGYGILDRWLKARALKQKKAALCVLIPILIYVVSWGALNQNSPPMPPYTIEEAVAFATAGGGTTIDAFPNEVGQWQGFIEGYMVKRETKAETLTENVYVVTFSESWKKGTESNFRSFSYRVGRGSMTFHQSEGDDPPYASY